MYSVNKAVALRIEQLLKEKGMTRYKLALESGLSHSTIKNIMSDTINDCRLSTIVQIASGFGISASEFLNSPLFDEDNLNI